MQDAAGAAIDLGLADLENRQTPVCRTVNRVRNPLVGFDADRDVERISGNLGTQGLGNRIAADKQLRRIGGLALAGVGAPRPAAVFGSSLDCCGSTRGRMTFALDGFRRRPLAGKPTCALAAGPDRGALLLLADSSLAG